MRIQPGPNRERGNTFPYPVCCRHRRRDDVHSHCRAKAGWDSLTDAELKVVNLIAQGVTNRDVATQLHLSLHTVKTHVRNAIAKLGINSRSRLTRFMRGSD